MLKNYLKIAWKVLGRNRFFTGISLFGIAVTLGMLVVVTTLYDHLLYPKYPEVNRERCTFVQRVDNWSENRDIGISGRGSFYFMEHYVFKMKTPEMVAIASHNYRLLTFAGDRQLSLQLMRTCENFWKVHEFHFVEGGPYTRADIDANRYVAVISEATRDDYFGKGKPALNQRIEVDQVRYQVIGVVQNVPAYQSITYSDIYAPYNTSGTDLQQYGFSGDFMAILLASDKSGIPAIEAEYAAMIASVEIPKSELFTIVEGQTYSYLGFIAWELFRADESTLKWYSFFLFVGIFLFMMLPALNLVNLNSSRIMDRASEIGVRKAFGATSQVLTVQFVVENIVLSFIGGLLGLILGWLLLRMIEAGGWIRNADLSINFEIFLTGLALAIFFGLLSGALPAWRMSRLRIVDAIKGAL